MKKALSVLLALAIALSLAVCAFAAKAPLEEPGASRFQSFAPAQAAPGGQSLTFELPTVTGITAVWDGNADALFSRWYGPYFNSENVTIAVSFEDSGSELLTHWWDSGYDWFWEILYEYEEATGKVTFYYWDSNLRQAYIDTLSWGDYWDWDDLYTMLPQAVITVPANLRKTYLDSLPKTALKLNETQKVPAQEYTIYTFTPEKDGLYYFYSENLENGDPYAYLLDADFYYIAINDDLIDLNFGIFAQLQTGSTYYLVVCDYYGGETGNSDVGVRDDKQALDLWGFLLDYLTGGMFLRRFVFYRGDLYSFPGGKDLRANYERNNYVRGNGLGSWLAEQILIIFGL